jgi:hypothetical protein
LNAYCLEFEGSPEASEEGVLYWSFPGVLKSADGSAVASTALPDKKDIPFSRTPRRPTPGFAPSMG